MYNPNKVHYVSATIIIVKDGKFLITKRSPNLKAFPGLWTVPGGKIESKDYERPKDTSAHWYNVFENVLKRETLEEVNLKITNIKYLTSLAFKNKEDVPVLIASFYTEDFEGKIKLSPENTEFKWVNLEDAKNFELIEGIYEELEMLDKVLKGENPGEWNNRN
ncbi:MAG: NUDIX domain-containing protein [archaeon]